MAKYNRSKRRKGNSIKRTKYPKARNNTKII